MYILRVIIKGFKTYRNETVVDDFSPHQNIVLGRNGSGKSNFFAAIRFVLSDEYSNLKREERQGLIHQGSGSVMSASVEIIFHDPDHRMILSSSIPPKSNEEIAIRRTVGLKKDDYQINDRNATRSEVVRMLESAGFSMSKPYNIVPQGKIIALTNAKDIERLKLLEDVVGANSFEVKLKASLKKMEDTEKKRIQIADEMEELNSKLLEMQEEKEELEKYQELEKLRKACQYTLYDRELADIINQIESFDSEYQATIQASEQYVQELEKRETDIESLTAKLNSLDDEIKIITTAELPQAKSKFNEFNERLAEMKSRINDIENQDEYQDAESSQLKQKLKILDAEIEKRQAMLSKITPRYRKLNDEEILFKQQLLNYNQRKDDLLLKKGKYAKFNSLEERNSWIQNEIENMNQNLRSTEELRSQLLVQKNDMSNQLSQFDQEIDKLTDSLQGPEINSEIALVRQELQALKDTYNKKLDERKELWRTEQKLELISETIINNVNSSERTILETMDRSLASGLTSVKEITDKLNLPSGSVLGTLGELIKVNDKYKICAEVIGGNSLFHIVVDTDETASLILSELQRLKGGRATFMPLNRIRDDPVTFPSEDKASYTPLIKKIKFDPAIVKAVKHVFGRTVVVRDLTVGLKITRTTKLAAITLDGDRADKGGVLTGGYHEFHKKSRLSALKNLNDSKAQQQVNTQELESVKHKIRTIDSEIDQINGSLRSQTNKNETLITDLESIRIKLNNKKGERQILEESLQAIRVRLAKYEANEQMARNKIELYKKDLQQHFDNVLSDAETEELRLINSKIDSLHNDLNITSETLKDIISSMDNCNAELNSKLIPQKNEIISRLRILDENSLLSTREELSTLKNEKNTLEEQTQSCLFAVEKIQSKLESLNAEKSNNKKVLDKANNQQRLLLKKLETFQKEIGKTMMKKTGLLSRKDELDQKIREIGLLTEDVVLQMKDESGDKLVEKLGKTNESLSGLKSVNKRAYENYRKFDERQNELRERAKELDDSKQSIQDLIVRLKDQKVKAVDNTFNLVAEKFEFIFNRLVPRGAAKLIINRKEQSDTLDNEGDIQMTDSGEEHNGPIYTGVSISVSFNSKEDEQLHVEQLSGGQKTLCAIALILAIQMVDPAPFYLFDEIDAALDKQYRSAVAETIKDLSSHAQFICTTFRTDMLNFADKFYRVKYENKISSVVEVSKQEAMKFAKGSNKLNDV